MKAIKAIGVILAVMFGIFILLVVMSSRQTESAPIASERSKLGPSELVCVAHLEVAKQGSADWKDTCVNIYIGMTPTDIRAMLGAPLPVERSTFAAGSVEHWKYFTDRHDPYKYVYLTFVNDRLDAIHQ